MNRGETQNTMQDWVSNAFICRKFADLVLRRVYFYFKFMVVLEVGGIK